MMPRYLFNAVCSACEKFKPRCAKVNFKKRSMMLILCQDCRHLPQFKGKFRFHPMHHGVSK